MKKITIILSILSILVSFVIGYFSYQPIQKLNKEKYYEYFDRTYSYEYNYKKNDLTTHIAKDSLIKYILTFNSDKSFIYYTINDGEKEILFQGTYYYDTQTKMISLKYEKDGETWNKQATWAKSDSNKIIRWRYADNRNEETNYISLTLEE